MHNKREQRGNLCMKKMARIEASTFPYGFNFFFFFTGALNEMKQTRVVETQPKTDSPQPSAAPFEISIGNRFNRRRGILVLYHQSFLHFMMRNGRKRRYAKINDNQNGQAIIKQLQPGRRSGAVSD